MRRVPRALALLVAAAVALLSVIPTSAGATARAGTDPSPTLRWRTCSRTFECASLPVPVDYTAPDGDTVDPAIIRARARVAKQRIGTLVVNFGGPGDAGTETLPLALDTIPAAIRDRFDIVSFDPRGTGGTRAIDCIDDRTTDLLIGEDPTPDDLGELERFYTGANTQVDVNAACIAKYGSWLAAVGTRNVARDVERIRVALPRAKVLGQIDTRARHESRFDDIHE